MATAAQHRETSQGERGSTRTQIVLLVSMALVSIALAAAIYSHAGAPLPVAAGVGIAVYAALHIAHILMWRANGAVAAEPAEAPRRPAQQASRRDSAPSRPAAPQSAAQPGMPPLSAAPRPMSPLAASTMRPAAPMATGPMMPEAIATAELRRSGPPPAPVAQRMAAPPPAQPAAPKAPPMAAARAPAAPPALPTPPVSADAQDYWSYRPAAPTLNLPPFVAARASAKPEPSPTQATGADQALSRLSAPPPAPAKRPAAPTPQAQPPREADVEVIQGAIKRLLEEVNAAEQMQKMGQQAPGAPRAGAPVAAPSSEAYQAAAVQTSLEALRMTADAMRRPASAAVAPPAPPRLSMPTAPPMAASTRAKAAAITDAIAAGRIDVLLDPILGLEDQRARHYEVSIRLRTAQNEAISIDDGADLRGTGLLPLFDCARIARSAAMARRLEERGKPGSLFSDFNGESLADDRFIGDIAEALHMHVSLASQLVLTFQQAEVRSFGPAEWETLSDMQALGFRFALAAVTDLDMDFEAFAKAGFVYAKLDADVFLRGLPLGQSLVPSNDVCRHLAHAGMTLVVEHIDDEQSLARIFGFGVLLGQGQLFGGPRPVRALPAAGSASSHAAA